MFSVLKGESTAEIPDESAGGEEKNGYFWTTGIWIILFHQY